jgi:hypothetical protein
MIFGTTSVVNLKREPYSVRVDRLTRWGNPTVLTDESERRNVVLAFIDFLRANPALLADVKHLRGARLGCHCDPLMCHGWVLALVAEGISIDDVELFL